MMEAVAWRQPAQVAAMPEWMRPFTPVRSMLSKKYVVSSTSSDRVDWNAELVRGDLGEAVQQLKSRAG